MQGSKFLYTLLLLLFVRVAAADGCDDNTLRRRDDGDDGDSCSSSSSTHHFSRTSSSIGTQSSPTGQSINDSDTNSHSHGGVSKGGIAGIVVGVGLGSLLLLLIMLCLHRRRGQQRLRLEGGTSVLAAPSSGIRGPHAFHAADSAPGMRTYGNIAPSPPEMASAAGASLSAAAALAGRSRTHPKLPSGAGFTRSTTLSSLPNPYDAQDEEMLLADAARGDRDRDLPPTPADYTHMQESLSGSPSSFPTTPIAAAAALLARGPTTRTTATTSSTLHDEMAAYQKRLEAHHEKELQARDDGEPSSALLPLDPPPEYRESLPTGSTSDFGDTNHETTGH